MIEPLPPIGPDTTKEEWEAAMYDRDLRIQAKQETLIRYLSRCILDIVGEDHDNVIGLTVWPDGTVAVLDKNAGGSDD